MSRQCRSHGPGRLYDMTLGAVIWVLLAPSASSSKGPHPEPVEEVEHALEILHDAEEQEAKKHGENP